MFSKNLDVYKDNNKLKVADDSKKRGANGEEGNQMLSEGDEAVQQLQPHALWGRVLMGYTK